MEEALGNYCQILPTAGFQVVCSLFFLFVFQSLTSSYFSKLLQNIPCFFLIFQKKIKISRWIIVTVESKNIYKNKRESEMILLALIFLKVQVI